MPSAPCFEPDGTVPTLGGNAAVVGNASAEKIVRPLSVAITLKWDETQETCKLNPVSGATWYSGIDTVHTMVSSTRIVVVIDDNKPVPCDA